MALPVTRALAIGAALLFVAGCAGGSAPLVNSGQTMQSRSVQQPATRTLLGPVVSGNIVVPAVPRNMGPGYMAPVLPKTILYVADIQHNQVVLFNPSTKALTQVGSITSGMNAPSGVAIDTNGVLYVANLGNNTVTEYKHGATTPFFTITGSLSSPYGIAVDLDGNVFVSNLGTNAVTAYRPHKTTPYATIAISGQPVGMASDSKENVYVASDSTSQVFFIKADSKTASPLALSGVGGPVGVAIGAKDKLYVGNFGNNNVTVYAAGKTTPSYTITSGVNQPTQDGTVTGGLFFQSDQTGAVEGYKGSSTTPYGQITSIPQPMGDAGYPRQGF